MIIKMNNQIASTLFLVKETPQILDKDEYLTPLKFPKKVSKIFE